MKPGYAKGEGRGCMCALTVEGGRGGRLDRGCWGECIGPAKKCTPFPADPAAAEEAPGPMGANDEEDEEGG